ncbi:MAG: hypothetical protein P9L95_08050 [Candidatus Tenebribacter mawsonii]|nr:hypothetical protein [Candidatus Tenebribacter mawsonii]
MKTKIWFVLIVVLFTFACQKLLTSPEGNLETPSALSLEQIDLESIQLMWQDNSSGEDGYQIDRKIGENDWEENYKILPENSTMLIDSNLVVIDNYSYRISAFSNNNFSNTVEASIDFYYEDVAFISGEVIETFNIIPSIELLVDLYDINWDLVLREYTVWFKIINAPEGFNINNTLFGTDDSLCVQSFNGQASVYLNPGNASGMAGIKVYVYNSNNEEISATKSNIVIQPSFAETAEFSIGEINSGLSLGNGFWKVEVSALLLDGQGNPISDGTAIFFSLPNNPEWTSIIPVAYIGNENANGDSIPGVAFTSLTYDGSHTNETVNVRLETGLGQIFESELVLPIQFPVIDIIAVPQHVDWWEIPYASPEYQSTEIRVTLIDGQNNPINNQVVIFSSTLGEPLEPVPPDTGDSYTGLTGIVNNEHGRLNKEVEFFYQECPPPIPAPPGTITCTITAQVQGTNASENVTIILRRYVN